MAESKSLKEEDSTIPAEHDEVPLDLLWESYRTSRAESMTAQQAMQRVVGWSVTAGGIIISALGFLKNQHGQQMPPAAMAFVGWLVIAALGMVSASQYLGEVGRMLRAGYYARQIERIIWQQRGPRGYRANLMWEGFLTQKKRRLLWTYNLGLSASVAGLIVSQVAPFWIFNSAWYYFLFPAVGALGSLILAFLAGRTYTKRFPSDDDDDSDPIQKLM
jgi:hypothetical protein